MSLHNPRVLVIDDYETVRMLFMKCLSDLGITEVDQAENGQAGLECLNQALRDKRPYDLAFVDWNMPKMNGLELLVTLRKTPTFADFPFVMVTSNSDESAVVDAVRAGVSDYLVKPFDTQTLGRTLERLFSRLKTG